MPVDNTIALQAKAPEYNPLAQMLQVRQYQNQTLQGNQLQAALNAKQAIGQAYANNTQNGVVNQAGAIQEAAGNPNAAYGLPEAVGTSLQQQGQQTQNSTAGLQNQSQALKLKDDQVQHLTQQMTTLLNKPNISYSDAVQMAAQAGQTYGLPPEVVQQSIARIPTDETQLRPYLQARQAALQAPQQQLSTMTPDPTVINNGNSQQVLDKNPITNPGIVGTNMPMQLPPTTPTFNPQTNTPGYLGPQPAMSTAGMTAAPGGMNVPPATQQGMNGQSLQLLKQERAKETNPANQAMLDREIARVQATVGGQSDPAAAPAPIQSGPSLGVTNAIAGTQDAVNQHYTKAQADSENAQRDIGILQNIKQYAKGAATGVGASQKNLAAGVAGMLGLSVGDMQKTSADELAKNAAMLSLAGGNTDAARAMAEAATPNGHMTEKAINSAADQLIAARKLALARTDFLTPFKAMANQGHPEMYNSALNQFNSVADPKVIQFETMTPDQKTDMKTAMSPQERLDFGAKLAKARQLGIAK